MTDTSAQIAALRDQLAITTDPVLRAALETALKIMEDPWAESVVGGDKLDSGEITGDKVDQRGVRHNNVSGGQIGAIIQGDTGHDMTLFTGEAYGNYLAEVIHIYQQAPTASEADYGAALRRYLKHLYASHATVDLRGIDDRPMDMPLSELYVSLTLHEPPPYALRGRYGLRSFVEKIRRLMDSKGDPEQLRGGQADSINWSQALRHSRIAVIGAPGSGKTTLLHYTTMRLAEVLARNDSARLVDLGLDSAAQRSGPPVPLLLPLRELGSYLSESGQREAAGANSRLLLDCLHNYYGRFDLDLPPDFFSRLCEVGRAILLLDGLDEVVDSDDRVLVSSIVRNFSTRYADCRYVVTARIAAYSGDVQIGAGFRICTVADLDEAQQRRFILNWSRSLQHLLYEQSGDELERVARRYADDFWRAMAANYRVRELATNPLLLTVVAVIFYNSNVLPENRAALYEECIEVLLRGGRGKADRAGQRRVQYGGWPKLSMGMSSKRELMAAIAHAMHCRGEEGVFVSRDELIRLVEAHLQNRADAREVAQVFVDELPVHMGLLDEREPDRFRFSHLSFQEFLAARHVAETDRWADLLDRYQDTWWREVIMLCAGHLSQERCWRFLAQLIQRGITPAERAVALGLAADALSELEHFKGQGPLNARIIQEALAILETPSEEVPAAARVTCGRALARLGDPRPGVCTLPPAMATIKGGSFMIGTSAEDADQTGRAWEEYWLKQGNEALAKRARTWPHDEINTQSLTLAPFELARYLVTNAQYALFMDDGGYDLEAPWWDEPGRLWLCRDEVVPEGRESWQKRECKDRPEFWDREQFGIARPNHPVVGVSWYEATAFCRWLTQDKEYNPDGYVYQLPTEAEWEYAARGIIRRAYSWGNDAPDGERANYLGAYNGTTAVGCFPRGATPEGVLDLIGNVWEWTRSMYKDYPYDPTDGREDLRDPDGKYIAIRGAGWNHQPLDLRASYRVDTGLDTHLDMGFRLTRRFTS